MKIDRDMKNQPFMSSFLRDGQNQSRFGHKNRMRE